MNAVTLRVLSDGTVQGLYTEAIDLTAVGRLRIERASTIEFDNPAQLWRVFDRRGRCITQPSPERNVWNGSRSFSLAREESNSVLTIHQ